MDILKYIQSDNWSEEQKATFSLKFIESFTAYLLNELNEKLPSDVNDKLSKLLEKKDTTGGKILEFYEEILPKLGERIQQSAEEYGKIFLISLYVNKVNSLEEEIAKLKAENKDSSKYETAFKKWGKILELAKSSDWSGVKDLI